jgi:hypothetical protein
MTNKINKIYHIIFFILGVSVFTSFTLLINHKNEIERLNQRADSLTQSRGSSWIEANGAPDSIYFVSFAGDTTWYRKITWECDAVRAYTQGMSDGIELSETHMKQFGSIPVIYKTYKKGKYRTLEGQISYIRNSPNKTELEPDSIISGDAR